MADKLYYVHFSGDNLGPISPKLMQKLIQMGRLHGEDYAAQVGQSEWTKICELPEFQNLIAGAPKASVPAAETRPAEPAAHAAPRAEGPGKAAPAKPAAEPVAKPAPKAEAAPAPKPVEKKAEPTPEPKKEEAKPLQGVVTIGKKMFKIVEVRQAGMLLEASSELEEGSEVQMQISGESFPKPFEMKAILVGKEAHQGIQVYMTEFVRPNPAHKRLLAPYTTGSEKE